MSDFLSESFHPGATSPLGEGGFSSLLRTLGAPEGIHLEAQEGSPTTGFPPGSGERETAGLPETIGRFRVLSEVGRGGIGVVYRVHDPELGRDLALKVLLPRFRGNLEACQRFIEESQIGGQLQHPGVVPVHEMGVLPGPLPYFTMKLVKGRTLAAILEARRSVEEDRQGLLSSFEQVAQTIAYAHSRGVIHRDLKPSNVMVGAFGEVQVMDWGLAKVLAEGGIHDERRAQKTHFDHPTVSVVRTGRSQDSAQLSVHGSILGTPSYMPPEQARGEIGDLDERSDVFGLGAILCEILTGKPPYTGPDAGEVRRRAEAADLAAAYSGLEASGADPELVVLARECLDPDPRHRPRDAGGVARVLRAYFDSLDRRAREAEEQAAGARIGAQGARRARKLTIAAGIFVVLALAAGGGGSLYSLRSEKERAALASSAVERALGEARTRGAEAKGGGPRDLSRWPQAMEATERAEQLAEKNGAAALEAQAKALKADLERDRAAAQEISKVLEREHEFAESVLRLRLRQVHRPASENPRIAEEYAAAFRAGGLDPASTGAAARIAASSVPLEAARALDEWAAALRTGPGDDPGQWRPLLEVALGAHPDQSAAEVRRAILGGAREKVRELAQAILAKPVLPPIPWIDGDGSVPPPSGSQQVPPLPAGDRPSAPALDLLLAVLIEDDARALAVDLARRAHLYHPGDFWLHHRLGQLFFEQKEFQESRGHLLACVALRKEVSHVWLDLGRGEEREDLDDEAVSAYRNAFALPDAGPGTGEALAAALSKVLDFAGAAEVYRKLIDREPTRADLHLALGEALRAAGDLEGAIAALAKCVSLDARGVRALESLAETLERAGKPAEAVGTARKIIELSGESATSLVRLGRTLLDSIATVEASAALETAAALRPSDTETMLLLALARSRRDETGKFLEALRKADSGAGFFEPILLERESSLPPEVLERRRRRWLGLQRPRWESARLLLRPVVEARGASGETLALLGSIELRLSDDARAAATLRSALEADPKSLPALTALALAQIREARRNGARRGALREEARSLLDRALAEAPDDAAALHLSAILLHDQDRRPLAMAELKRATEKSPGDLEARMDLARALFREARTADIPSFVVPNHPESYCLLSEILRSGNWRKALSIAREALRVDAGHPRALSNVGSGLLELGRLEEAARCYQESLRQEPLDPRTLSNLGRTMDLLGRSDEAERLLSEVIRTGQVPIVYANLVDLLHAMGKPCRELEVIRLGLADTSDEAPDLKFDPKGALDCPELEAFWQTLERVVEHSGPGKENGLRAFLEVWVRKPSLSTKLDPVRLAQDLVSRTGGGDPEIQHLLARVLYAAGRKAEAIAALEESARLQGGGDAHRFDLPAWRREVFPDLPTFASIDAELDHGELILPRDAAWSLFPGTGGEPSPGLEWTLPGFADGAWKSAKGPCGFRKDEVPVQIEELLGEKACLYLRASFRLDPGKPGRVFLSVRLDDGAAFWLNGREVGRIRAGKPGERLPHTARADSNAPNPKIEERIWLPADLLREGENHLAVQLLNVNWDFVLDAEVRRERPAAEERERLSPFRATAKGANAPARIDYLEGRLLGREGKHREAAERFGMVVDSTRAASEPLVQLRLSLVAAHGREEGERLFRGWLEKGPVPNSLVSGPAEPPSPLAPLGGTVVSGTALSKEGVKLEVTPFVSYDPTRVQSGTVWEVWPEGDTGGRNVYAFERSDPRNWIDLPPGLLLPGMEYLWRANQVDRGGRRTGFSREARFRTADFPFRSVTFDLSGVLNRDVVANPGDRENETFDGLEYLWTVDGFDGTNSGRAAAQGLPADGRMGIHRLGDYSGRNVLQLVSETKGEVRIPAPRGRYGAVRLLVAGGGGSTEVPLRLEFAEGEPLRVLLRCPDWTKREPDSRSGGVFLSTALRGGDIVGGIDSRMFGDLNNRQLFEALVETPADRELISISIEWDRAAVEAPRSRFNLLAITGVAGE